ncbi:MAG: heme-binding protein [Micrococcales bacterium]|nr:heme-binding protein [Micrococcales bacterium]
MHRIFRITLDDALPMLAAARRKAEEIGVKQTLCVVDESANVIALHRLPGARLTGVDIAIAKAFTAAGHERATHKFNEPPNGPALPGNEAFGISHMLPGKFAIFVGGFPIEYDGQIVGGFGVSGGNGDQDKAVGAAALAGFAEHIGQNPPDGA